MPDKKITDLTPASFDGKRKISLIVGRKFLDDGAIIIRHCTLDINNMQFFIIEGTGVSNPKISNDWEFTLYLLEVKFFILNQALVNTAFRFWTVQSVVTMVKMT